MNQKQRIAERARLKRACLNGSCSTGFVAQQEPGSSPTCEGGEPRNFSFMEGLPLDVSGKKARPKFRPSPLGVWRGLARCVHRGEFASRFSALILESQARAEVLYGRA